MAVSQQDYRKANEITRHLSLPVELPDRKKAASINDESVWPTQAAGYVYRLILQ